MTGKQILPIPRNRTKPCTHVHYSGRRCSQRIKLGTDFCGLHKRYDRRGATICDECTAMLEAFPIRKTLEGLDDGVL